MGIGRGNQGWDRCGEETLRQPLLIQSLGQRLEQKEEAAIADLSFPEVGTTNERVEKRSHESFGFSTSWDSQRTRTEAAYLAACTKDNE
jgi:hypothetical protein